MSLLLPFLNFPSLRIESIFDFKYFLKYIWKIVFCCLSVFRCITNGDMLSMNLFKYIFVFSFTQS